MAASEHESPMDLARKVLRDPSLLDEVLLQFRDPRAIAAAYAALPALDDREQGDEQTAAKLAHSFIFEIVFNEPEIELMFIRDHGAAAFAELLATRAALVSDAGLPARALAYLDRAAAVLEHEPRQTDEMRMARGRIHAIRGDCYRVLAMHEQALAEYAAAIEARAVLATPEAGADIISNVASTFINRGNMYLELNDHAAASLSYQKAKSLYDLLVERNDESSDEARDNSSGCVLNMGLVARAAKNHEAAVRYFTEAIEVREELPAQYRGDLASALMQRADAYVSLRRYNEARADLARAVPICREIATAEFVRWRRTSGLSFRRTHVASCPPTEDAARTGTSHARGTRHGDRLPETTRGHSRPIRRSLRSFGRKSPRRRERAGSAGRPSDTAPGLHTLINAVRSSVSMTSASIVVRVQF